MKLKRFGLVLLAALFLFIGYVNVTMVAVDLNRQFKPSYARADLSGLLKQTALSAADYELIFEQTGLGKPAIDDLRSMPDYERRVLSAQDDFFKPDPVDCLNIGIITRQDTIVGADGNPAFGFVIAPLRNGDILISFAQHSLGWRHGHAGMVVDAPRNQALEALELGLDTAIFDDSRWRIYPTFVVLRARGVPQSTLDQIAAFAAQNMIGKPYALFTGIWPGKIPVGGKVAGTQCAHVVWYPYKRFGIDIDPGGDWLIAPVDILRSGLFDIVQVYGLDPVQTEKMAGGLRP